MRWQQLKQTMRYGMARFFYGRNGPDQLSAALLIFGFFTALVARFSGWLWLLALDYVSLALCIYRMLSRNLIKRRTENARFLAGLRRVTGWFGLRRRMFRERHDYRYLKCKKCGQRLRVPRGKGKIEISCSRCAQKIIKKNPYLPNVANHSTL